MLNLSKLSTSARVKLALIPLLAAILLSQLWPTGQLPPQPETSALGDASPQAAVPSEAVRNAGQSAPRNWPEANLPGLLKHDPFEPPPALSRSAPAPAPDESEAAKSAAAQSNQSSLAKPATTVLRLESKRVSVVLISPQGASAVVDSKFCRVNDWLEPGVRVAEIRADGVVLSLEPLASR